jgi:hemoglobin
MPSIFQAIAVDEFYARALADELLAPFFDGVDLDRQKRHLRAFLAAAIGGPDVYAGRDLRSAHAHLAITDAAFDRVVEHLVATLGALSVPEPLVAAIAGKLAPLRGQVVTAGLREAA